MGALAAGDARRLAPLLGNELQAAAVSLNPELRRTLRAGGVGRRPGRNRLRIGPHLRVLVHLGRRCGAGECGAGGRGVCRTVRVASGPVHGAQVIQGRSDG